MAEETQTQSTSGQGGGNQSGQQAASLDASRHQSTTDRPAYVPETFWDADKREVKTEAAFDELKKFSDERAAAEQRKATLPKAPNEYAFTPPEGFKLPDGAEIDTKDPMWGKLQTLAHAEGLSPDQFSKLGALAIDFRLQQAAAMQKSIADFKAAEEAKLGDNSKARVEAIHRFVDANVGSPELATAVKASIANAPMAEFLEKTIAALSAGGITAFNGNGRDQGPKPGEMAGYDKMSFTQRYHARQRPDPQQRTA